MVRYLVIPLFACCLLSACAARQTAETRSPVTEKKEVYRDIYWEDQNGGKPAETDTLLNDENMPVFDDDQSEIPNKTEIIEE